MSDDAGVWVWGGVGVGIVDWCRNWFLVVIVVVVEVFWREGWGACSITFRRPGSGLEYFVSAKFSRFVQKEKRRWSFRAQIEAKLPTDSFSEMFAFLLPSRREARVLGQADMEFIFGILIHLRWSKYLQILHLFSLLLLRANGNAASW